MNLSRAFLSGIIVWTAIFLAFTIMSFIPALKNAETVQTYIVYLLLMPILFGALTFYYKKGQSNNGFQVGLIIILTCLLLDALITVPLVIIPHGGDYISFFINPLIAFMGLEILLLSFGYWATQVKRKVVVIN